MMQKKFNKFLILIVLLLITVNFMSGITVHAQECYDVYNYDHWNETVPSQAGYLAKYSVSGKDLGIGDFSEPSDIFRDSHDRIFIADTKNNRIVVTNSDLTEVITIMDEFIYQDRSITKLKSPKGIYIAPESDVIYIADSDNSRVLVCDCDCNIKLEITKPESELFLQELTFMPQKVLADKAGNIYIILDNITTGSAMFNHKGEFLGYYGANTVETTSEVLANYFWKLISTEEMRSRTVRTVPASITNFDSDDEGFIYTCTQSASQKKDTVKKMNPAGTNLFSSLETSWGDYEAVYDFNTNKNYQSMICDIDISDDGNINCLDFASGRVFQYDEEGNLLFILGSSSNQLGGFTEVSALESVDNNLFVLDAGKNTVTVFEETNFGEIVHEATGFYNDGYYEEALALWYEVLQYDGNYRRAFLGISSALLVNGDYKGSMKYAKLASSSYCYNKAFECYRSEWLSAHMNQILIIILIMIGIKIIYVYLKKRKRR